MENRHLITLIRNIYHTIYCGANANKRYAKPTVLDLPLFTPAFSSSKIANEFIETLKDELILLLNNKLVNERKD